MIGHLRGTLLEKHPNEVIVEAGGVGYQVAISVSTFSSLPNTGTEVRLRIHTIVREDAFLLYGFLSLDEKALFEKLISVSGIGPKLAITVLSGIPVPDLVSAIRGGNVQQLTRVPGIGKKTAERLVVELRDKVDALGGKTAPSTGVPAAAALTAVDEDVLSALVNLGCPRPAAETAIRKARAAGAGDEFEPLFRKSLEMVR
ncbi:MAG: Holliday junction branch migration protein RuvA [Bryobacterales bacterium]|nr:Holliday junction branch migration protein RuvA [Bryobacterales bacterium]